MKTSRRWPTSLFVMALCAFFAAASPAQNAQAPAPAAAPAAAPAPAAAAAPEEKIYKNEQLDQLLAQVALYPDSLLAQLLMACTYPGNVAEAAEWSKANPNAKGDDAVKLVADKQWDPSVQSLVAFPQVLVQLQSHPDWVQKVGDAFLAQPEDVMGSVQRLRAQAQKAGNLKSNEQQKVVVEQVPAGSTTTTVIQIEPTDPQVVYVPSYNPTMVYGSWAYPSYPPPYWPPPAAYYPVASGLAAGLAFGAGIAITNSLWGGCNWGNNDVNINVNKYNNINNSNNRISGNGNSNWKHNANNRQGTPYADNRSRQQYGQGVGGAQNRQDYRGQSGGNASRERAAQSFNKSTGSNSFDSARAGANNSRGGGSANASQRAGGNSSAGASQRGGAGSGNSAGASQRGGGGSGNSAFSGASKPQSASRDSSRGQSSMQSSRSSGGGSRGGSQVSRPTPQRSGGGGGRRR